MIIKNLKNKIDFYIREKIKFKRNNFFIKNEDKTNLFEETNYSIRENIIKKEKEFFNKYHLNDLKDNSTIYNYKENLYIIDLLTKIDLDISNDFIKILDIGSKNWFYARGEYNFFKYHKFKKNIEMTGIELDAYRVYTSFYSRYDSAAFHIKNLENTRYIAGDLLKHNEKYDFITWFFPFVIKEPLLYWGLPLDFYLPEKMLKHAYSLLKKGGTMIILNQGIKEFEKQKELLKALNIKFKEYGEFKSEFLSYKHCRYCLKVYKS